MKSHSKQKGFQLSHSDQLQEYWHLENQIPGSKYLANRLLILAALSHVSGELKNMPLNDDIKALFEALVALGYAMNFQGEVLKFEGNQKRKIPQKSVKIDCGASGTMARFICAVAALDTFEVEIFGSDRLQQRPMLPLFEALIEMGAEVTCLKQSGCLPVRIKGSIRNPTRTSRISLPGNISSQYISALLLIGAELPQGLMIDIQAPIVSATYIQMTLQLIELAGVKVIKEDALSRLNVAPSKIMQKSQSLDADPCSASYVLAAAVLNRKQLTIKPFHYQPELQGEYGMIDILREMGAEIQVEQGQLYLNPATELLTSVQRDMGKMPDIVQTLAVLACFAKGTSRFNNIAHLKLKESDRIVDTATELQKCGVTVTYGDDWLEISGLDDLQQLKPSYIDTHHDHRMAMSLAQLGWLKNGFSVDVPEVVNKSFPGFWELMRQLGLNLSGKFT